MSAEQSSGRSHVFGTGFWVWIALTLIFQAISAVISHFVSLPTSARWEVGLSLEVVILGASVSAARWAKAHPGESLAGHLIIAVAGNSRGNRGDRRPNPGVSRLWGIWAGLLGGVVFIGVALGLAMHQPGGLGKGLHLPRLSSASAAVALVAVGVACAVTGAMIHPPLQASSDNALRASYMGRFFLWIGLSEVPLMLGIVAILLTNHFWLYFVGAAFALLGLARTAPTERSLDRDQAILDASEHPRSLREALDSLSKPSGRASR